MPNPIGGSTQGASSVPQNSNSAKSSSQILVPFARAAKSHVEQGQTFSVASPWGGKINAKIPTYGFLTAVYITTQASGGSGSATVATTEDAPWNVYSNILLTDVNGTPIYNIDGYSTYLARLYGGYKLFRPDISSYAFSAVATGANASGNFKTILPLFLNFGRDLLGSLPNMDASAAYNLILSLNAATAGSNPLSNLYSTAPTNPPTLNITVEIAARARPTATDPFGNTQEQLPPTPGTVQYWTSQQFTVNSGNNTIYLSRVGNLIRNHILIFRDSSNTRSGAETNVVPSFLEFDWDSGQRFVCNTATLRQQSYEITGIDAPNGVVPLLNTEDADGLVTGEFGDDWLPTVSATKLALKFTSTQAGTLTVLTNDIVPGAGNIFAAPIMQFTD
jgi:hypothetical protein